MSSVFIFPFVFLTIYSLTLKHMYIAHDFFYSFPSVNVSLLEDKG